MSNTPKKTSRPPDGFAFFGGLGLMAMVGSLLGRIAADAEAGLKDFQCSGTIFPEACLWLNSHAGLFLLGVMVVVGGFWIYRSMKRDKSR